MVRTACDEDDVVAGLGEPAADAAADGTRPDDDVAHPDSVPFDQGFDSR
ncbi:hypothetical protein AB0R12_11020 [Streptomyces niveus]